MENSIKFTLIIDKLNRKISELNIKISKDFNNDELQKKLQSLLEDRDLLYKGNVDDVKKIIEKYGDTFNE
jgi:predicted RNase H-like nuclease (RuvC/YqgF family)